MPTVENICNSIKRGTVQGLPWNHLCTLPAGHLGRHECWSGYHCCNWSEEEADGRVPVSTGQRGRPFGFQKQASA